MNSLPGGLSSFGHLIANREWYHQHFDGVPLFIFAIADAELREESRKPPAGRPIARVCVFAEGKADWYLNMDDIRGGAESLLRMVARDPDVFMTFRRSWAEDEIAFERFFWEEFPKIALAELTDGELSALWNRSYGLALARLSSSAIIDHFALGTDALIHRLVREEARARAGADLEEAELNQVFTIVTAPEQPSFITRAEISLLRIATGISSEALDDHRRRYFWIRNNFSTARSLSVEDFENEILRLKQSGADLAADLARLESAPRLRRLAKAEHLRKFSDHLRGLLAISDLLAAWQDERKRATYFNIHVGSEMLRVIGARKRYEMDELKYATAFEIAEILNGRGPSAGELAARARGSVFVASREGTYVTTGDDVERVRRMMGGDAHARDLTSFKGMTASLGKARGVAKVIRSVDDLNKMNEGDILVAVMTRPDFVPGMRMAAAIVTDEGGITSHAAIISRELGIPCIIATKIATRVLNDGDGLDVDADASTVTILEKARS